jgi:hypothetical protein
VFVPERFRGGIIGAFLAALAGALLSGFLAYQLLEDERGPVGLYPEDRKYGQAFMGGPGSGKSSQMARRISIDAADRSRVMLAKPALGLIPADRAVHYIDLAHREAGSNPLAIEAGPGARASVFVNALIEANPEGAIGARSDALLRQAVDAVYAAEERPTTWHIYRMLTLLMARTEIAFS